MKEGVRNKKRNKTEQEMKEDKCRIKNEGEEKLCQEWMDGCREKKKKSKVMRGQDTRETA